MIDEPDINTITHEDDQFVYGIKTRSGQVVTEWVRWKGHPASHFEKIGEERALLTAGKDAMIGRPIPNLDPLDTIPAAFDSSRSMILMPTVPTDQMIESAIKPYTTGISPELVDIFRKCVYLYYTRMVAAWEETE